MKKWRIFYFLFILRFVAHVMSQDSFLEKIEKTHQKTIFYEMNASLYPKFMQKYQIESVPCLLIQSNDEIKEKIYTFYSIPNIYQYLYTYKRDLFQD